jgi:hypothetical protein
LPKGIVGKTISLDGFVADQNGNAGRLYPGFGGAHGLSNKIRNSTGVNKFLVATLRNRWLQIYLDTHFYGPTLSSTQMLPDSSAMVNTSLSWVRERSTVGRVLATMKPVLPNDVT